MTMEQQEQYLDLLGTFHYIMAVLTAIMASLPLIYLFIGIALYIGFFNGAGGVANIFAFAFIFLAGIVIIAGWIFAILIFICGKNLKERRSYNFCLVIAFLECLIVPIGTVLGLFTIVTLTRDKTSELFS